MRITSLGAFGLGFVLGARAGKEAYDQIREAARTSVGRLEAYGASSTLAQRQDGSGLDGPPAGR